MIGGLKKRMVGDVVEVEWDLSPVVHSYTVCYETDHGSLDRIVRGNFCSFPLIRDATRSVITVAGINRHGTGPTSHV